MAKSDKTAYAMLDASNDHAANLEEGLRWLIAQGGGTVYAPQKSVIRNVFEVHTDGEFKRLERDCALKGIALCWPRKSRHVSGHVLALYCDTRLLADLERYSDIDALLYLPLTEAERDWFKASYLCDGEVKTVLPDDIERILSFIADMSAGYDSGLNYREERRLKCDLMVNWEYWREIDPTMVRARCIELGMKAGDADTIAGFVRSRREGKRFNPPRGTEPFRH